MGVTVDPMFSGDLENSSEQHGPRADTVGASARRYKMAALVSLVPVRKQSTVHRVYIRSRTRPGSGGGGVCGGQTPYNYY